MDKFSHEQFLSWFAGLFEGEGSIIISGPPEFKFLIKIEMTDKEIMDFVSERLNKKINLTHSASKEKNNSNGYSVSLTTFRASGFLKELFPYLRSERVREKAILGIYFQENIKTKKSSINRTSEYKEQVMNYYLNLKKLNKRGI